jgi:lantibiotic modifying enzyme
VRIDKNMQDARKSNIPSFSRGSSSKSVEEKKKKVEGQESSSDGIKELTQLIKQMEINHANQINALQNRFITMERSQANRTHHKPNDKWPKRTPPHDQRPPNPFESTNLVYHQAIPYCRP